MATKKDAPSLTTASVLAFERKLDPSDALMHAGSWPDRNQAAAWHPIAVNEKSVRGTISHRLKTKDQDPAKLDAAIENPNPQTVDVAALPAGADTLRVSFTLRVLGGTGNPSACNSADYKAKLHQAVTGYKDREGFAELARRYAHNLANGRFLWRNRIGAESVEVRVSHLQDGKAVQSWAFDAMALSLRAFDSTSPDVKALAKLLSDGLTGSRHVLLQVTAFARIGDGQEVFPSQELIMDRGRGDKSKTLYQVNKVAGIHSQKIGNALRTVDTWYPDADELGLGPIAVEPYGSVTTEGKAYRQPKRGADFYTLLDNWILRDTAPDLTQQHFVMATLIRGGVFGDAGKD